MATDQAAQLAAIIAQIPAGTVSPEETPHPVDLLVVGPLGGAYTLWGRDLGVDVELSRSVTVGGTFSWMSADTIPNGIQAVRRAHAAGRLLSGAQRPAGEGG